MTHTVSIKFSEPRTLVVAWIALLAFETLAQLGLKAGGNLLSGRPFGLEWVVVAIGEPWVQVGIVGYLGAFAAWMTILDRVALSLAFPLTATIMIAITVASYLVFGETITLTRTLGIVLIVLGVVVIGRSDP